MIKILLKDRQIVRISNSSYGISIDKAYVNNGQLKLGQIVDADIIIKEEEE